MDTIEQLTRILSTTRTIAIVGLSAEWHRPSFFVGKYMQQHGYRIIPVNPKYAKNNTSILGEKCYSDLSEVPLPIDMVDIFRRTEDVLPIAEQALRIGAKCLWQQIGVINEEATKLFNLHNLDSISNRCVKIEHGRLFGGLNLIGVNTGIISSKRQNT